MQSIHLRRVSYLIRMKSHIMMMGMCIMTPLEVISGIADTWTADSDFETHLEYSMLYFK